MVEFPYFTEQKQNAYAGTPLKRVPVPPFTNMV